MDDAGDAAAPAPQGCTAAAVAAAAGATSHAGAFPSPASCIGSYRRLADDGADAANRWFELPLAAFAALDERLHFTAVNDLLCAILGRARDELCGQPFLEILHADDRAAAAARLHASSAGHAPQAFEARQRLPDGGTRWLAWTAVAHELDQGVRLAARDVTVERRLDATLRRYAQDLLQEKGELERQAQLLATRTLELERARQAALAASEVKSGFLAQTSHEIRTPMTAIVGYAELLLEPCLAEDERRRHVQTILRNGSYLLALLDDILDLSKVEAGKLRVEVLDCSPFDVVEGVAALMRHRARQKGLDFGVEWIGRMPRTVRTDPLRLHQVLTNLVGNAIKFTERGEVRIAVRMAWTKQKENPRLSIEVVDTGIGLSADQLDSLFRPFAQADASTPRRFGGTGLGLSISRRLAELLGGGIAVSSTPGVGSTFVVTVDAGPAAAMEWLEDPAVGGGEITSGASDPAGSETTTAAVSPSASALAPTGAGEAALPALRGHVLLAEDGLDNQRLMRLILQKAGAEVTVVENGRAACERALMAMNAGEAFAVVLMDVQMPEMDGLEATALLRRSGYAGPIVALTARAMAGDRERCLAAGCDDYVTKPVSRRRLLETVARHLADAPSS